MGPCRRLRLNIQSNRRCRPAHQFPGLKRSNSARSRSFRAGESEGPVGGELGIWNAARSQTLATLYLNHSQRFRHPVRSCRRSPSIPVVVHAVPWWGVHRVLGRCRVTEKLDPTNAHSSNLRLSETFSRSCRNDFLAFILQPLTPLCDPFPLQGTYRQGFDAVTHLFSIGNRIRNREWHVRQ